jgi:hypothetical protein
MVFVIYQTMFSVDKGNKKSQSNSIKSKFETETLNETNKRDS